MNINITSEGYFLTVLSVRTDYVTGNETVRNLLIGSDDVFSCVRKSKTNEACSLFIGDDRVHRYYDVRKIHL